VKTEKAQEISSLRQTLLNSDVDTSIERDLERLARMKLKLNSTNGSNKSCLDIMIIDDDPVITDVIVRVLTTGRKIRVRASNSSVVSLIEVGEKRPDILLVDWKMPQIDGVEMIKAVEAHYPGKVGFILMSGYGEEWINRMLSDIRFGWLGKPFTPEQLIQEFTNVMKR